MKRMLLTMALAAGTLLPAAAQDRDTPADTVRIQGKSFSVEVIGGKVILNGEEWTGDGPLVLDEEGELEIDVRGPHRVHRMIRRGPGHAVWFGRDDDEDEADDENVFVFETDDDAVGRLRERVLRLDDDRMFFPGNPDAAFGVFRERRMESREVREMERNAERLARDVRRAEGDERAAKEAELRKLLESIFDRKMALREEALQKQQKEMAEERARLDRRRQARADIVERRLKQLLGERDVFAW